MLKDVTLGRYCEKEGPLHSLNPVLKLCVLLLILVSLFLSNTLTLLSLSLLLFTLILIFSRLKLSYVFRGLGAYFFMIIIFSFIRFALYHFTASGAEEALIIALRLLLIVLYSSLFTCTTSSDEVSRAMEVLFRSRYLALVFSVALRFIPVLSEEAKKIHQAQLSRCGLSYAKSKRRIKAFLSVLVPLFSASYRRSLELSMAMDSRCFSPEKSTHLYSLEFKTKDWWTLIILAIYLVAFVFLRFV